MSNKKKTYGIGSRIKLKPNAVIYGTSTRFPEWVYGAELYVRDINKGKVTVSILKAGGVNGDVDEKYINAL